MKVWSVIAVTGLAGLALAAYLLITGPSGDGDPQAAPADEAACTTCDARHKAYSRMKDRLGDQQLTPARLKEESQPVAD